jgi:hypothetical protein
MRFIIPPYLFRKKQVIRDGTTGNGLIRGTLKEASAGICRNYLSPMGLFEARNSL